MFRKMPFILLAIFLFVGLTTHWMPISMQAALFGISLSMKSLIVSILPFVVFGLLFKAAVQLSNQASKLILFIFLAICCSNLLSSLISFVVGKIAYSFDLTMNFPNRDSALIPLGNFTFPQWIGNDKALFSGLFFGFLLGWLKPTWAQVISNKLEKMIKVILKGILFIIPLFLTGFVIKMNHDKVLTDIFLNYFLIFFLIASTLLIYIIVIFFFANHCQYRPFMRSFKNMLPAAVAGFGSMSSAAAMPLTLIGAEKNAKNQDLVRMIIPTTVNIHLIGDCFAIPIFAFAVLKGFGLEEPSFSQYIVFALYFVLAKFSVAAVPGGGILVMLPIIEKYLHFNAEMLSLITALYILFDPVITCANVLGNGGFALGLDKLTKYFFNIEKESMQEQKVIS